MSAEEADEDEEDEGKTATFPFLNKLFGSAQSPQAQPLSGAHPAPSEETRTRRAKSGPSASFWRITASP